LAVISVAADSSGINFILFMIFLCNNTNCIGKFIVSSSLDSNILVYDIVEEKVKHSIQASEPIWTVTFSPDAKFISCGTANSAALVYDVESGIINSVL
jgi:WD40 repeat protein